MNKKHVLVVGGGIGGLAAALTCSRLGAQVDLLERFNRFSEISAGIQLGPNVVKILQAWGLKDALESFAAFPDRLQVRSAMSGHELGVLRLGATAVARYGTPYATIHRADLHAVLFAAVKLQSGVTLSVDSEVTGFTQQDDGVTLKITGDRALRGDLLVGADGLWSQMRLQLLNDGPTQNTGHLAYRAQVPQSTLPQRLRSQQVTAWLGPQMHIVQYPIRRGEWLNVVAIVHGRMPGDAEYWDHTINAGKLRRALAATCTPVRDLIHSIDYWRLWALNIRPPMQGPLEQAQGRVALLGDAAHPMLPYLAQGAGMAIEDAEELGRSLANPELDVPAALKQYAARRWQRNARVQARSLRNGQIFHATGFVGWGRDMAMKLLGERLLDMPWLYRGPSNR